VAYYEGIKEAFKKITFKPTGEWGSQDFIVAKDEMRSQL
jgi:hypothetical protein